MNPIANQGFFRAVHKRGQASRQPSQPEQHCAVEHGSGGRVAIPAKYRLSAVPEKQLIAVHFAAQVENRLTRHVAHPRHQRRRAHRLIGHFYRFRRSRTCRHANLPARLSAGWRRNFRRFDDFGWNGSMDIAGPRRPPREEC